MVIRVHKTLLCSLAILCVLLFAAAAGALFGGNAPVRVAQASASSGADFLVLQKGATSPESYSSIGSAWLIAKRMKTATITMYSDATASELAKLTVEGGEDITLDLNGHKLEFTFTGDSGSVIEVKGEDWDPMQGGTPPEKAKFTLTDSSDGTRNYTYKIGDNGKWEFGRGAGYTNTLTAGGLITGGKYVNTDTFGGGVSVQNGIFTMTGGTIAGNTAENGGGVSVGDMYSSFIMSGNARICGNAGRHGGGVYAAGDFRMSGNAEICDNTAQYDNESALYNASGGGVYVNGIFTMKGGTIARNTSNDEGGGVVITGNGGDFNHFAMTGGTITGNASSRTNEGGGVCIISGDPMQAATDLFRISGNPAIYGNERIDGSTRNNDNVSGINAYTIVVTGALTEGAEIYVHGETGTVITGYTFNAEKPSAFFKHDSGKCLQLNATTGEITAGEHSFVDGTCSVCGETMAAQIGENYYPTFEEAWAAAKDAPYQAVVKMLNDAEISQSLSIASNDPSITLDVNGHVLALKEGVMAQPVICINGGTFFLMDSDPDAENTVKSAVTNERITVRGGVITGGRAGGIYIGIGGTFEMDGGTIAGNVSGDHGGGVCVGGDFYMYNGTISHNQATRDGGGVYAEGHLFTMSGGTIAGNAAGNYGGGVMINSGTFELSGAVTIAENVKGTGANTVANNLYLQREYRITVSRALKKGNKNTQIGITLPNDYTGAFATDYGAYNKDDEQSIIPPSVYFFSDAGGCIRSDEDAVTVAAAHEYDTEFTTDTAATCTEAGSRSKHCKHCVEKTDVTAVAALGHEWGEWETTKLPTADEFGEQRRVCAHDGTHVETRQIEKLAPSPAIDTPTGGNHSSDTAWTVLVVIASVVVAGEIGFIAYRIVRKKKATEGRK